MYIGREGGEVEGEREIEIAKKREEKKWETERKKKMINKLKYKMRCER